MVPGVASVDVDLDAKRVTVAGESRTAALTGKSVTSGVADAADTLWARWSRPGGVRRLRALQAQLVRLSVPVSATLLSCVAVDERDDPRQWRPSRWEIDVDPGIPAATSS